MEAEVLGRRDEQLKGGVLAGKWLAGEAEGGRHARHPRGRPGVPALDDRVTGMLKGLGALK